MQQDVTLNRGSQLVAYIIRKIWLTMAVFTVALAVLVTLLRQTLPHMDNHKRDIQTWLFEQYGAEVDIGYISAIWQVRGPAIVLKNVTLARNANSPIALTIDETQVELDLLASLRSWQIHSKRFNLLGMQMDIDLAELKSADPGSFPIVAALETLFLEQLQRFSISDSTVTINTQTDRQRILIQQLSWLNKDMRHQGVGELKVAELANNSARFVLDLAGGREQLAGTFYAKGEDLDLAPWVNAFAPAAYDLQYSRGNFELWADLRDSQVTAIQANLGHSEFAWQDQDRATELQTDVLKGQFFAKPSADGWLFNVNELMLMVDDQVLTSHWAGQFDPLAGITLNSLQPMQLRPALPLANLLLGTDAAARILALSPSVVIDDVQVQLAPASQGLRLNFSQFNSNATELLPGVQDVAGTLSLLNGLGHLTASSANSAIKSGQHLGYNLEYDQLELAVYADLNSATTTVYVPSFTLSSDTIAVASALAYDAESDRLQVVVDAGDISVTDIKTLFPRTLMKPKIIDYLRNNLQSGGVSDLQAVWSGAVGDFPFAHNQGVFQAAMAIRDTQLQFHRQWPALTDLDVDLLFENDGLRLFGHQGKLLDVAFTDIVATIPKFKGPSSLHLQLDGNTSGTLATGLMQVSSLQRTLGKALDVVQVIGPIAYEVGLVVPLTGGKVQASGEIRLHNNLLSLPSLGLQLPQTAGVIAFQNQRITANSITAELWGQPLAVELAGQQRGDAYQVDLALGGQWDLTALTAKYHPGLQPFFVGDIPWQGDLALIFPKNDFSYRLRLRSSMPGVAINLPAPLRKQHTEERLLSIASSGDNTASSVRISLGEDLEFNGILPHADGQFSRAHLSVGEGDFMGMGLGFSISGQLASLPLSPWYRFVDALLTDLPTTSKPFLGPPQRVFINADSAVVAGRQLHNTSVRAKRYQQHWEVDLHSDQARAKMLLEQGWMQQGVRIDADYLNLPKIAAEHPDKADLPAAFTASDLPPLHFTCGSCQLYDFDLGKVELVMTHSPMGMSIDKLELANKQGKLVANGDWFMADDVSSTLLQGEFSSDDFGVFLKDLGFESGIRDSDAAMTFDISWRDTPFAVAIDTLNGDIKWHLSDGYLTEVSDQGARIFSILSLDSLIRKLRLDFRDVFAKGFFYQEMDGTFQVVDGRVSTDDTVIDGAAAKVRLAGFTNLADQRLNYTVAVKPNLTSSLPVLFAWMVNPATAVAALALDEVIASANVVSKINYSVTGTLADPVVELLEQASEAVILPAQQQHPSNTPSGKSAPTPATPVEPLLPADPVEPMGDDQTPSSANGANG